MLIPRKSHDLLLPTIPNWVFVERYNKSYSQIKEQSTVRWWWFNFQQTRIISHFCQMLLQEGIWKDRQCAKKIIHCRDDKKSTPRWCIGHMGFFGFWLGFSSSITRLKVKKAILENIVGVGPQVHTFWTSPKGFELIVVVMSQQQPFSNPPHKTNSNPLLPISLRWINNVAII